MDRAEKSTKHKANAQLNEIGTAQSLVELDNFLTQSMAKQQIQALIKEDGLDLILQKVEQLAKSEDESAESGLLVLALLGRLSAVARGRESSIFKMLASTINAATLPALESSTLDGDGKFYAAHSLSQLRASDRADYVLAESVALETAEKARRLLIELVLHSYPTAAKALTAHTAALDNLVGISNSDSRLRKARRISSGWVEVIRSRSFELGERPGEALVKWISALLVGDLREVEESLLFNIVDDGVDILLRIIELRFSHAMLAETYQLLPRAKALLGRARWIHYLSSSKMRPALNMCLREAALVLARQGKTDSTLLDLIHTMYQSKAQMLKELTIHFGEALELDPDVRQWWITGGSVSSSRRAVHKVGNNEDQMIGELLIEVLNTEPSMQALRRTVAPMLEISDPVTASNVISAAAGYAEIAQTALLLARMRKLKKTELKGMVVEFNPLQHELLSSTSQGVREVRVIRDGVQKDFGGSIKTLVKPRVEPLA
ncbi:hypothetical protein [Pseudomonas ogarae]|uniref:hypothetical protein n=1 Tax=Pseudomonas ogarae (strain DSM 112162 / CECT 30235 / F113) TaxID=1114970 RepID=UPI000695C98D|nr:hypothetical protein [Pseudomonas ogarae]